MKKSIAFLLASLATTTSLLFHTQEAKAAIKECLINIPASSALIKANSGRYKGTYVIFTDIRDPFREPMRPVGKDEKSAKKYFKQQCKQFKN